jgi:hypothetical protein
MDRSPHGWLLRPEPVILENDDDLWEVVDVDQPKTTWRLAATMGLLPRGSDVDRVPLRQGITPAARSGFGLSQVSSENRWLLLGGFRDPSLGAAYWSLRALGARPIWLARNATKLATLPAALLRATRVVLYAPSVPRSELEKAAQLWSNTSKKKITFAPDDPTSLLEDAEPAAAWTQVQFVTAHAGFIRFPVDAPGAIEGRALRTNLRGILAHDLRSPDPRDPDGLVLARRDTTRALVSDVGTPRRVTRTGLAEVGRLSVSQVMQIPHVPYDEAVAAPFRDEGFAVMASDKGLYQQRTLALAGGLRFLAWLLRQSESECLLRVFFEYHGSGKAPPEYRRAVRFDELRQHLLQQLRERRSRLRSGLVKRADEWLSEWASVLVAVDCSSLASSYVARNAPREAGTRPKL